FVEPAKGDAFGRHKVEQSRDDDGHGLTRRVDFIQMLEASQGRGLPLKPSWGRRRRKICSFLPCILSVLALAQRLSRLSGFAFHGNSKLSRWQPFKQFSGQVPK